MATQKVHFDNQDYFISLTSFPTKELSLYGAQQDVGSCAASDPPIQNLIIKVQGLSIPLHLKAADFVTVAQFYTELKEFLTTPMDTGCLQQPLKPIVPHDNDNLVLWDVIGKYPFVVRPNHAAHGGVPEFLVVFEIPSQL